MSRPDPILILQMQRMGDLVLSFPLVGWLKSLYPETPIRVVGEKAFFQGLVELSPPVTYFSYEDSPALEAQSYSLVINLSHRPEAAALAGRLQAGRVVGPSRSAGGNLYIGGDWQLYRASISHNNRHNLFHWADLNALDVIPQISLLRTSWPPVKRAATGRAPRVGLFVGASEPDKRPEPEFWAALARRLLSAGARPVFLGGAADQPLARRAAQILGAPAMNLSGKFSIIQLCRFITELDLLVVPDTGPMHIAAWAGVPVLNLSVGPVNPWETGPFAPGHHVLRPALSCAGCWSCTRKSVLCKERLGAEQVAVIAGLILEGSAERLSRLDASAGRLYRTRRDAHGLFDMEPLNPPPQAGPPGSRAGLARFWQMFFALELAYIPDGTGRAEGAAELAARLGDIRAAGLDHTLLLAGQSLAAAIRRSIQGRGGADFRSETFWLSFKPAARPLASYIQLLLHNGDFRPAALARAMTLVEDFVGLLLRA